MTEDAQISPLSLAAAPAEPLPGPRLATSGPLARIFTVEGLRQRAAQRLPRAIFDYVDGGGEKEITLRGNMTAFDRIGFRPRTVADIARRSQAISLFGRPSAAPFGIGPMGGLGLLCRDADIVLARAAAKAGIPYVLATGACNSMEQIAAAVPDGRRWFQLYVLRDREMNRRLLQRAAASGFEALVITTDTQLFTKRWRDLRNGFGMPMRLTLRNALEFAVRPSWLWTIARNPASALMGNLAAELGPEPTAAKAYAFFRAERSRSVGWDDIKVLRDMWKGPLLIKGLATAEEASRAAEVGAQGIVVSNHGGRSLDGTIATIDALPEIAAAVGDRLTVLLDSGIRRGSDILKAVALGAHGTFVARPMAYALAAGGPAGAEHAVAMFIDEIDRIQGLLGCADLRQLDPSFVVHER